MPVAYRLSPLAAAVARKSRLATVPAPVGGLNARDSLASMQPTQAVVMDNFFPTSGGLKVRNGWLRYYYDVPAAVETLIKYNSPAGSEKLFAVAGGNFIDATSGGAYDVGDVVAGPFANSRWQYVQMANQFGDFTVAVNGADTPQKYNGTAWSNCVLTSLEPSFDPTTLIHVAQMHRRLWFVEKDSARVWYLPVDEVEGVVKLFDCGEVFPLGGYCQVCTSWSVDTGKGMDDQSIFISSKGNVAVFTGFDPDNAPTDFTLAGVYDIGSTIGRRCTTPYGSDVLILCEAGVVPLTTVLSQSKMLMQPPLSDIIQLQLSRVITQFGNQFGWDLFTSKRHNQLYVNIPDPASQYQYVMNTVLDAWCRFLGYTALCWAELQEEPMFGGPTYVGQAFIGTVDDPNVDTGIGTSIQTMCLQAFSYFGSPSQKQWGMARPIFLAGGEPRTSVTFLVDFNTIDPQLPLTPFVGADGSSLWDADDALWDVSSWAADSVTWQRWYGLEDIGFAGAILLKTATVEETAWVSTDFTIIEGGVL